MTGLIDTHCHLNFDDFRNDLPEVLARAQATGVEAIIIPGSDLHNSEKAIALASAHPNLYAAVGVHPHEAQYWKDENHSKMQKLAQSPQVIAIGEIGLDYYRNHSPREAQLTAFRAQIDLAAELRLPVLIHNRESTEDMLTEMENWFVRRSDQLYTFKGGFGIFHSFSGDIALAEKLINWGFLLGISGPVTYQNRLEFQALVTSLPLNKLVLETDSPYLTPYPHRGRRNEPAHVRLIAEKIAKLKGLSMDEVVTTTTENVKGLFGAKI